MDFVGVTTPIQQSSTGLRFLQIHFFYEEYLRNFYMRHPEGVLKSFEEQIQMLVDDGFSGVHLIAPYMRELGYDSQLVIANNAHSQVAWLQKNASEVKCSADWIKEVVKLQIEHYKPDVLYLTEPLTLDSKFLRTLDYKPKLVLGWRAANIPEGTDWSSFDVILSSLKGVREIALKLGARSAEHFWPGFPTQFYDKVKDIRPAADLTFCGQWTLGQHHQRNAYLRRIAHVAADPAERLNVQFYLSGAVRELPPEVQSFQRGSRFGLGMYQAIHLGRITFDARGSIEIKDPTAGNTVDLAQRETANMRLFEATGCGSMLLTEHYDNLTELFEPGRDIVTYRNEEELIQKIRYYARHETERAAIAENGRVRCHRDHSMSHRVKWLDSIIRKHLGTSVQVNTAAHQPGDPLREVMQLINDQRTAEALAALDQMSSGPSQLVIGPVQYLRGIALGRLGRTAEAIRDLEALLQSEPSHTKARFLVDELKSAPVETNGDHESTGATSQTAVNQLVDQALGELSSDKTNQAFETLVIAKQYQLPIRQLDHARAICFLQKGSFGDARQALLEELRHFPDNRAAAELLELVEKETARLQQNRPRVDDPEFRAIMNVIQPYTMLPEARLYSLFQLAKHVCTSGVPGNFVECGVAGGGSTALLAKIIRQYSTTPRIIYACDSFEGMPRPTAEDVLEGVPAEDTGWGTGTCSAPEQSVMEIAGKLGVQDLVRTVKGYFENTLPRAKQEIGNIALLHIDCDWYQSALTTLRELYPQVSLNAAIQLDDYGYWDGMKKAVDQYQQETRQAFEITTIDGMSAWFLKAEKRTDTFFDPIPRQG